MDWTPDPAAWRDQFAETGYLVVENAVEPDLLRQMRDALERIERAVAEDTLPGHLRRWVGSVVGGDTITNIMELPLFDPVFRNLIVYPRVLDILEAIFETTEFGFHNYKCIGKMPGGRADFPWHRDLPYLPHTSANLVTCMVCMDAMTEENGATVVCPGTHHDANALPGDTDIPRSDVPDERVAVLCPAGSAVLIHINLIHGGPPNGTTSKRRNVIGIWSGPDAHPTGPHRYAYQGVMPRSADPLRRKQIAMAFANGEG